MVLSKRIKTNTRAFVTGCIIGGGVLVVMLMLPGCNTITGLGVDIQRASQGIQGSTD